LIGITVDGRALDLQTSSLFAKGTFQAGLLSNSSSHATDPTRDFANSKYRKDAA